MVKGYKTSKDYKRLKELLDNGYEVVCFTTYDFNQRHKGEKDYKPIIVTDVCRARFIKGSTPSYDKYVICARGICYRDYYTEEGFEGFSFEEACEADQIEFIEPEEDKE